MKILKNISLVFTLAISLTSCVFLDEKPSENIKKQWVYVELVTESKTDTTEYFYFGQIRNSLVEAINLNENKKGLFTLSNIRYWNDNNLLELYEDDKLEGDLIFKIQDIEEVILYKDDPINLFKLEELHESAKKNRTTM